MQSFQFFSFFLKRMSKNMPEIVARKMLSVAVLPGHVCSVENEPQKRRRPSPPFFDKMCSTVLNSHKTIEKSFTPEIYPSRQEKKYGKILFLKKKWCCFPSSLFQSYFYSDCICFLNLFFLFFLSTEGKKKEEDHSFF